MRPLFSGIMTAALFVGQAGGVPDTPDTAGRVIPLSGIWHVTLDPKDEGIARHWFAPGSSFDQKMPLPGTTDQAGLGTIAPVLPGHPKKALQGLQRRVSFEGPAWYQKDVEIPKNWEGKCVALRLERVLWASHLWIDGKDMGSADSLSTPHLFELGALTSGHHAMVIRIDNRSQYDIGRSHARSDDTQTAWNGIVGLIQLEASPRVRIDTVWIDPNPSHPAARIRLVNAGASPGKSTLRVMISGKGVEKPGTIDFPVSWDSTGGNLTIPLDRWGHLPCWDEFHPNLLSLDISLKILGSEDSRHLVFGLRDIRRKGQKILFNGHQLFLRGTHEGCSFPLTGYPPMDVEGWRKVFHTIKSWGLNHMRFHSYCPPEACFTAADEEGVYLQAELPLWAGGLGKQGDEKRADWVTAEAHRMLAAYGNHPSFLLFSLGNELHGEYPFLRNLLGELKAFDPRHLYTLTSNRLYVGAPGTPGKPCDPLSPDDFLVERQISLNGKGVSLRGQGYLNAEPNTTANFSEALKAQELPVITHEVGQWCVFPNIAEIPKYTGVLRPVNLEAIRNALQEKGLLPEASDFTRASGKFAAELYKEEVELALRSHPLSGFQLLDLHDYPGQGTAHIGLLDSFWESKGIASASWFRQACNPVTPLALLPKRIFTAGETLAVRVEFANFSEGKISGVTPSWTIPSNDGKKLAGGMLPRFDLAAAQGIQSGEIRTTLPELDKATEALLTVQVPEARASNSWRIWIYPSHLATIKKDILITASFAEAKATLQQHGSVLYCPPKRGITQQQDAVFLPAFWSPVYFTNQPGTMGLLIRSDHAALADFPTADHTDWQWWYPLANSSGAVVLDDLPSVNPIIQVIPSFAHPQKLAMIFDVLADGGHLVVCTIDLVTGLDKDPVRRQLRSSLLEYLSSPSGSQTQVGIAELENLFHEDSQGRALPASTPPWSGDLEPPPRAFK
jgi:hypothetical protein